MMTLIINPITYYEASAIPNPYIFANVQRSFHGKLIGEQGDYYVVTNTDSPLENFVPKDKVEFVTDLQVQAMIEAGWI
jgi:hypothetical protein